MAERMAEHRAAPGRGAHQAQQHPDRGGLPGAVRAHETGDRASGDAQIEPVHGHTPTETLRKPEA